MESFIGKDLCSVKVGKRVLSEGRREGRSKRMACRVSHYGDRFAASGGPSLQRGVVLASVAGTKADRSGASFSSNGFLYACVPRDECCGRCSGLHGECDARVSDVRSRLVASAAAGFGHSGCA